MFPPQSFCCWQVCLWPYLSLVFFCFIVNCNVKINYVFFFLSLVRSLSLCLLRRVPWLAPSYWTILIKQIVFFVCFFWNCSSQMKVTESTRSDSTWQTESQRERKGEIENRERKARGQRRYKGREQGFTLQQIVSIIIIIIMTLLSPQDIRLSSSLIHVFQWNCNETASSPPKLIFASFSNSSFVFVPASCHGRI